MSLQHSSAMLILNLVIQKNFTWYYFFQIKREVPVLKDQEAYKHYMSQAGLSSPCRAFLFQRAWIGTVVPA